MIEDKDIVTHDIERRVLKEMRLYGIIFIILSVITFIFTYEYVFPIGSITLALSGIYILFMEKINKKINKIIFNRKRIKS